MSRRKAESYIEVRTSDGLTVAVELPTEAMVKAVVDAINEARSQQPRRRRLAVATEPQADAA